MKTWKTVALGVMSVGLALQPMVAAARAGRPEHARHFDGGRVAEFLGLSDEQRASWTQLHEEFRAALKPGFEQQRETARKLHEALQSEAPDAQEVGKLAIALSRHHKQVEKQHEALQQRLRALLTPEQQAKFDAAHALRPRRGFGHGAGHGFGPFGGFGPHLPPPPDGEGDGPGFVPRGERPQDPGF